MDYSEVLYSMALSRIAPMNHIVKNILLDTLGSATAVYENRRDIKAVIPDATSNLQESLLYLDSVLDRCKEEMDFAQTGNVQCITKSDPRYPQRLLQCPDAPILLYYCGHADLNLLHMISMVGTRHCTDYGKDLCRHFVADLKALIPDVVIVSGLAYGIDVNAHRAALDNDIPTIGVLAHGLDQIYPRVHRDTAVKMVSQGGLLTEYMSRTTADKKNFVARNRIVAGICDATIVVESASKGGSLITAGLANEYNRDVFAFPGRVTDEFSAGCNKLIAHQQAASIASASDFVEAMNWTSVTPHQRQMGIQRELFVELSDDEQKVVDALKGSDGIQANLLSLQTGLNISLLTSILFDLELKGVIRLLNGGMYKLV